jgi:hypothetical protein
MKKEKIFEERSISGTFIRVFSLKIKFVNLFKKITDFFNTYCKMSRILGTDLQS